MLPTPFPPPGAAMNIAVDTGDKFSGFGGASLVALIAGVIATAAWALLLAWRWWATYPRMPDAGPATNDLGDESPAVANLLVNRWKVTRSAAAGTLIDLAARHLLGIEQYVGEEKDEFVVRLREDRIAGQQLTPYERQVLDHVRARATGGSAPVQALDLGEPGAADAWWKRFSTGVVNDARHRGLARTRWTPSDLTMLGAGLAIALGLFAFAFGLAHLGEGVGSGDGEIDQWDWFGAAAIVWFAGTAWISRQRDLRDTPAGRAACARWLGVRQSLRDSKALDDAPPAAVATWERYLSFGVAMGIAHEAAQAFPFAPDDPSTAWSRYGGTWHEVRVEYPERFGFGQPPLTVFLGGVVRTLFWGGLAFVALPIAARAVWDVLNSGIDLNRDARTELAFVGAFLTFFSVAGLYLVARLGGGLIRLWRGGADLGRRVTIEGEIVKVHLGRVALDDGRAEETQAWFPPPGAPALARGMRVRATMSPRLRNVSHVDVISVPPAAQAPGPSPGELQPAATGDAGGLIDVAAVRRISGLDLSPAASQGAGRGLTLPGGGSVQAFSDAARNTIVLGIVPLTGGPANLVVSMATRAAARGGADVEGLGKAAWWVRDQQLVVDSERGLLFVYVDLPGRASDDRLRIARDIATAALGPERSAGQSPS